MSFKKLWLKSAKIAPSIFIHEVITVVSYIHFIEKKKVPLGLLN